MLGLTLGPTVDSPRWTIDITNIMVLIHGHGPDPTRGADGAGFRRRPVRSADRHPPRADASAGSSISSTVQQMSMSFGVAVASLATALFISDRFRTDAPQMIHGIHEAFLVLGGLTVLTAGIFIELKKSDGDNVSQHKVALSTATRVA